MKYLLVPVLLISLTGFSQKNPNLFLNKLCLKNANNIGESKGIIIQLNIPCEWVNVDNNIPHGILKYDYKDITNNILATEGLLVSNLGNTTDEDAKYLITEPGLRLMTKGATGKYISFNSLLLNDVKGGEVIMKNELQKSDGTYLHYTIQDYFIYNRKIIMIQYTITSKSDVLCKKYLLFFSSLLKKTKINT